MAKFLKDEVKQTVWECNENKCPGLDGYNFYFTKACWDVLREDIVKVMKEFHRNCVLPKGANENFLTLIPEVENSIGSNEFRPISLVGCLYKIVAKILSICLRKVLHKVIHE